MTAMVALFVNEFTSLNPNVDNPTQSFAWAGDSGSLAAAATDLETVINAVHGADHLGKFLSPALSRSTNGCLMKSYDITTTLAGGPHGSPIASAAYTMPVTALGNPIEAQLAVVVDYHGAYGAAVEFGTGTRPRSRLRGRHYWGPLSEAAHALPSATPWEVTVDPACSAFFKSMYTALIATTTFGPGWGVWSRKNASLSPVQLGWVDTTVHVQRRRQDASGVKVLWP